jgi:hypothetical protein
MLYGMNIRSSFLQSIAKNSGRYLMGVGMIEVVLDIIRETADAFLVSDGDREVWLPKSQIGNADDLEGRSPVENVTLVLPEWLATEKGLM